MNVSNNTIRGFLLNWRARLRGNGLARQQADDEPPLRSELFSADQMEQHGKTLAGSHELSLERGAGPAPGAAGRERGRPDRGLQSADGGGQGEPPDHAGRRMAARQLLPDRRTDPHGQAAPAEGLQPGAAAPGQRPVGRASARVRHRPGDDLARRRTGGSGESQPLRGGLPDRHRPQAGRAVGHPDHAAPGADRESPARRGADRRRQDRPQPARTTGRTR